MPKLFRNQRDALRLAKAGNMHYELMYGDPKNPRVVYPPEKPKRASPVRDPRRVSEADVNDDIRKAASDMPGLVLYRNNRGMVDLPGGGKLRYGVGPNGGSDWIGYRTIRITPEMVGERIAQFVAIEAKAPDAPRPPDNQIEFIGGVAVAGGISGFVQSADDLIRLIFAKLSGA